MNGVRARLNLLVAAITSLVLLAFLAPIGLLLRRAAEERATSAATIQAQSAAALVTLGQDPPAGAGAGGIMITIFHGDTTITGTPAPRTPSIDLAARGRSFVAESGDGLEVLVPVQGRPDGTAVVRAFAPESLLHEGVLRTWFVLIGLGLVLFALGVLLADRLGRRLVGSVTELAATADRLSHGDLAARVRPSDVPELRRVGDELNHLAGRIQGLLAAQREEAADLAHRLRTPVTALRLDADSIADADERARLVSDVDALQRLVDEVIRTARRPVREGAGGGADLVAVTRTRVAFWAALAEDVGRPVLRELPAHPLPVRVAADDLTAALDALLDNVFTHTPEGSVVLVEVAARPGGGGQVTVADAGAGLSYAGRGASPGGSTGLGLDIARRTAESSGGAMTIGTSRFGGASVTLEFPAPT